jgi:eukaryotic-like serine/threonine-protein kinase
VRYTSLAEPLDASLFWRESSPWASICRWLRTAGDTIGFVNPPRLGNWVLEAPIGRGGMGTVWRARHADAGFPVALKLMTAAAPHGSAPGTMPRTSREIAWQGLFRNEARAMARLYHPAIVGVLDQGLAQTTEVAAAPAGTPWIAMELVEGGTLEAPGAAPRDWAGTADVLRRVLAGLAHAHARGLLHRDVKPTNVLLPERGAYSRARLADLGLARSLDEDVVPEGRRAEGTPAFMAPEQAQADWRQFGPSTDLYAVGCLAWTLVTGTHPFSGTTAEVLRAHIWEMLPPFAPRFPVPADLEGWLLWLLEKDPAARPPLSAVAAAGLDALGPPVKVELRAAARRPTAAPTLVPDADADWLLHDDTLTPLEDEHDAAESLASLRPKLVPVPQDWRRAEPPRAPLPAGLGVLGLRRTPMLGRESHRDRLWSLLVEAANGPRLVVVEGPSGVGKSRLAEWISERAHEAGCAGVLVSRHGPLPSPRHGPAAMLGRFLRVNGLAPDAVQAQAARRLSARLTAPQLAALTERLSSTEQHSPAKAPRIVFRDPAERRRPLLAALAALAQDHPLVVWMDDVQWGLEAIELARDIAASDLPILVVLVAEDSALAGRPVERERLAELEAPRVQVAALGGSERRGLLHQHLGLDRDLADQLDSRTRGNPLFALQLIQDLLERGNLIEGAHGWRLQDGVSAALPASIHGVWASRLRPVYADLGDAARDALEVAAVVGGSVDMEEWSAICDEAGLSVSTAWVLENLLARALATQDPDDPDGAWRLVHGMLRESIERIAMDEGRGHLWHRAAAAVLSQTQGPAASERRAHHLLACGAHEDALGALLDAIQARFEAEGHRATRAMLDQARRLVLRLDLGPHDAHRGRLAYLEVRMARVAGDYSEADRLAGPALEAARAAGWPGESVRLAAEGADLARLQGRLAEAWALLQEVQPFSVAKPALAGMIAQRMGTVCFERGEGKQTIDWALVARRHFVAAGDVVSAATTLSLQGVGLARDGRFEEAAAVFDVTAREHEQIGCRWGLADTMNNLGFVHQQLGDRESARAAYLRSAELWDEVGGHLHLVPRLNHAILLAEEGHFGRAREALDLVLGTFRDLNWAAAWQAQALAALALCHAGLGDRAAWAEVEEALDLCLDRAESVDPDVHRLRAGALALWAGREQ